MFTQNVVKNCRSATQFLKEQSMSGSTHTQGVPLQKVVEALNNFANVSLAGTWDNVGLLIEPSEPKHINHVLLTNDLTEKVMQEAVERKTDMIVSYHPPIFAPMKRLTAKTWKV